MSKKKTLAGVFIVGDNGTIGKYMEMFAAILNGDANVQPKKDIKPVRKEYVQPEAKEFETEEEYRHALKEYADEVMPF